MPEHTIKRGSINKPSLHDFSPGPYQCQGVFRKYLYVINLCVDSVRYIIDFESLSTRPPWL